jgi:hypothetical protein
MELTIYGGLKSSKRQRKLASALWRQCELTLGTGRKHRVASKNFSTPRLSMTDMYNNFVPTTSSKQAKLCATPEASTEP